MKIKFLLIFLLFNCFVVSAQNKSTTKKIARNIPETERIFDFVPQIKDFAFILTIDKDRNVRLTIQKTENSEFLADNSDAKSLADFFSAFSNLQNSGPSNKQKNILTPILIVKASPVLTYRQIMEVIQSSRISPNQKTKIEVTKDFYVFIPTKAEIDKTYSESRPNPLTLVVKVDKNLNITLNNEEQGSLKDTVQLKNRLERVFAEREANSTFREGTNIVEKTVFIRVPLSLVFEEMVKLINALRESGTDSIGLEIDNLEQ